MAVSRELGLAAYPLIRNVREPINEYIRLFQVHKGKSFR